MLKKKVLFTVTIFVLLATAFVSGAMANEMRRIIEATECKDIYLTYNGDAFLARDANENIVYPLVLNGTTYLPVRAVSAIAGLKVEWNGDTRTVHLTSSDYVPVDNSGYSIETEINDTKADANTILVDGGKFRGRVGETLASGIDEKDLYKFVVSEHGIVDIKVTGDSESGVDCSILNMDGDEMTYIGSAPADGIYSFRVPLKKGTYYLEIDGDSEEMAYKIDMEFLALPNDFEDDGYESDVPPVTFKGNEMIFEGAVGTYTDLYVDHIVVKEFNNDSITIDLDWVGNSFEAIRVTLYDEAGYTDFYDGDSNYIGDFYLDSFDLKQSKTIQADKEIYKVVVTITPSNYTTICDEYTIKISK